MNTNLIAPAIFYLSILIYVICLYRHGGFEIMFSNFEMLKYNIGTSLFFFLNINVLFFCSFCGHCYHVCIPLTLLAVTIGLLVYLSHLGKQTVNAIKQGMAGEPFDFMAPFFSIPYFVLIYEIVNAMLNAGLESLHDYESKMLIVLLYPFFVAVGELTSRIKQTKEGSESETT